MTVFAICLENGTPRACLRQKSPEVLEHIWITTQKNRTIFCDGVEDNEDYARAVAEQQYLCGAWGRYFQCTVIGVDKFLTKIFANGGGNL